MNTYYNIARSIVRIFQILSWQDCKVTGSLTLPVGGKIIAGNHPNATDGLFLPFVFREQLYFFVQGDIFDVPIIGWLLAKAGQIAVVPGQKHLALEHAIELVDQGKTIVIFPEARLNPDHLQIKSGTGAIRISLSTHAPIIPIGFYVPGHYLHHITRWKKDRLSEGNWQFRGHCFLHIGEPWSPAIEIDGCLDASQLHRLTDRLTEKIEAEAALAQQDCSIEHR